ncbi:hypothetical protein CLOSTHATH_02971 [Hungatella hathewayi DSM 13479]|uniref:Uncharacterized protein n=1 Tax=Hungatella hathewayi DSM 13479 TaxID=566550 RepID=D3AH84_9FIRM|nr:hypothetical protein CLOSTHATH_02971 [Hungatella hathewayi DSM 13479]
MSLLYPLVFSLYIQGFSHSYHKITLLWPSTVILLENLLE